MFHQKTPLFSLFEGFSDEQINQLNLFLDYCRFPQSTIILEQGQAPTFLYILLDGLVEICYKPYDGPPLTIANLTQGDIFGWSAAMGGKVSTATAVAVTDCQSFRINHDNLYVLCHQYPPTGCLFLEKLASGIAKRIQSTHLEVLTILHDKMRL